MDIWRELHPTTKGFTHRDVTDPSRQLRLDSYVVSPDVIPLVVACDILSSEDHLESDHIPVTLTLAE